MLVADIFVSYNRVERVAAQTLRQELADRGFSSFLDSASLPPGRAWPERIEEALGNARITLVLIGRSGLGGWQRREIDLALEFQRHSPDRLVIPLLWDGADPTLVPGFLRLNTWIDSREFATPADVWDAIARVLRREVLPPAGRQDVCPYVGIHAFTEDQEHFFFGREAYVDALSAKVLAHPIVAVVGPSGVGKSSVVRAGLLPRLRRIRSPDPAWEICTFRPDRFPYRQLADALLHLLPEPEDPVAVAREFRVDNGTFESYVQRVLEKSNGATRLLLVVDQFEELFTRTAPRRLKPDRLESAPTPTGSTPGAPSITQPDDERDPTEAFIESLVRWALSGTVSVVITLRADFYGDALRANRELADAMARAQVPLGPLTRNELRAVIEEPAKRVGLEFEPNLVDRILSSVVSRPGALPLLEYALAALWNERQGRRLTGDGYSKIKGVEEALADRAERIAHGVPADVVRYVFQRLVRAGQAGDEGGDTRRRAGKAEFPPHAWQLALRFAQPDARLLVFGNDAEKGQETVEIVHEALIRHWRRWKELIDADRDLLVFRQRLEPFLETDTLLPDAMLSEARRWLHDRRSDLFTPAERELIARSLRRPRWAERVMQVAAVLLVVAGAGGLLAATYWRSTANQIRLVADGSASTLAVVEPGTAYEYLRALVFAGRTDMAIALVNELRDGRSDPRFREARQWIDQAYFSIAETLNETQQTVMVPALLRDATDAHEPYESEDSEFDWRVRLGLAMARAGARNEATRVLDGLSVVNPLTPAQQPGSTGVGVEEARFGEPWTVFAARQELARAIEDERSEPLLEDAIDALAATPNAIFGLTAFALELRERGLQTDGGRALDRVVPLVAQEGTRLEEAQAVFDALIAYERRTEAARFPVLMEHTPVQVRVRADRGGQAFVRDPVPLLAYTVVVRKMAVARAHLALEQRNDAAAALRDIPMGALEAVEPEERERLRWDLALMWVRLGDLDRAIALGKLAEDRAFIVAIVERVSHEGRIDDAERLTGSISNSRLKDRGEWAVALGLARVGRTDDAGERLQRIIQRAERQGEEQFEDYGQIAAIGLELARHGAVIPARRAVDALKACAIGLEDRNRSGYLKPAATILARLRQYGEARSTASDCHDSDRHEAYAAILREYAKEQSDEIRTAVEHHEKRLEPQPPAL